MKKLAYLVVVLSVIILGCKSDFDEVADMSTENGVINDSIHKMPVSKLPDEVKEAFNQVFVNENISAKSGEINQQPSFDFLEDEVIAISKKEVSQTILYK